MVGVNVQRLTIYINDVTLGLGLHSRATCYVFVCQLLWVRVRVTLEGDLLYSCLQVMVVVNVRRVTI